MKFKLGTQTEEKTRNTDKRYDHQGQRSRSQGNVMRLTGLPDISRTKCPRNTKIGTRVVHTMSNNAHQFQGHGSKVKVTRLINAET